MKQRVHGPLTGGAWIGRLVKSIYDWLPVAFETKAGWKAVLFTTFPSWFSHTSSYKRWVAFARPMLARADESQAGADSADATHSCADQIYMHATRVARGARSIDHADYRPQRQLTPSTKLIAFYLPQFHPFPENDEWWGRGFTEWTNVSKAQPQFVGHHQPRLPGELGFYDLRVPEVMRRQVELAREYGVQGFCFHYYWFAGRRLLERPLDAFVASDIEFPFCICWANENWTRRWDGRDEDVLIGQEHGAENDLEFIADLAPLLADRRYVQVDGRPLVVVYRPSLLPDPAATAERWRAWCRDQGLGEIFLAMVQFDVEDPIPFGFDCALEFPPHRLAAGLPHIHDRLQFVNSEYRGYVVDFGDVVERAVNKASPGYPLIRGVFPSWDNEARKPGGGYTFANSSPAGYRRWLSSAIAFAQAHPVRGESMVFINAWNEWAEGAYLEPDRWLGYANLQATRDALEEHSVLDGSRLRRLVFVSHDAHPHGAQYLALHVVRELHASFDYDVHLILLGSGRLAADFAAVATVHDASGLDAEGLRQLAQRLVSEGCTLAITNTTVAGLCARALAHAGMRVVSLVHELPGLIRDYGLSEHAHGIAESATRVVFAAPQVRSGFSAVVPSVDPVKLVIRPQGLFVRNPHRWTDDMAEVRAELRQRLGIAPSSRILLAVGYGDRRKGLDLFGEAAERLADRHPDLHFVWVGHFDERLMAAAKARLSERGADHRFHAVGLDFDTALYYPGADVYALTSREDPFPSVVLEALSVGLPVVAFAGTGGAEDILRQGSGRLVPAFDVQAFADEVSSILEDDALHASCARAGRTLVEERFGFRQYVFDLLGLLDSAPPKVSVVVPNYNYSYLLRDRLFSIVRQTLPVYEVIVLDDASSDDSLSIITSLRDELCLDIRVCVAEHNSGSVFRQWLKGVEMARGDYVWIAEADDLSDPDFLATVTAPFLSDRAVVMSYCDSRQIDETNSIVAESYDYYIRDVSAERWTQAYVSEGSEEVSEALAVKNTIPNVSAAVFRRQPLHDVLAADIEQIAGFRIAGDWVTYIKLLRLGKVAFNPRALNVHRRHSGSVTSRGDLASHLREILAVQDMVRNEFILAPAIEAMARAYAQSLYVQFGLVSEHAPSVDSLPAGVPQASARIVG